MEAVRRWNARRRSPSAQAIRDAGPPTSWLAAGALLSLIPIALLFAAGIDDLALLLTMPFLAFALVGRLDRDGWRIRMAMTEVAVRQRQRWTWGTLPIDPITATAWLGDHPEAPPDVRTSVMATAGRLEDARALVGAAQPDAAADIVRLARLRIAFAAQHGGDHSIAQALTMLDATPELAALPASEQRYQRLSLSWSIAWLRIRSGEPWRTEFAAAVRAFSPFRVPMRFRVFQVLQQYALAVAYLLAWAIVWAAATVLG